MQSGRTVRFYQPEFQDPYPRRGSTISEFRYESDLYLLRLSKRIKGIAREAQYIVAEPYTVSFRLEGEERRRRITVPRGMVTDLASVPSFLRWYVGRVGPHLEAAIVHDFLYGAWLLLDRSPGEPMRRFADNVMLVAMQAAGMCGKARVIHRAVRMGGRRSFHDCQRRYVDLDSTTM